MSASSSFVVSFSLWSHTDNEFKLDIFTDHSGSGAVVLVVAGFTLLW